MPDGPDMPEKPTDRDLCTATRKDGSPCTLPAVASTGFCFAHGSHGAAGRSAGGSGRRNADRAFKLLPAKLRPLFSDLKDLYRDCRAGEVSPEIARACAQVARTMVLVLERGQLEEQVQAIERAAAAALEERSA
jgi:hypothetical protein